MRKTRMEKGITLIALIITIVVLLILAVVAISSIQNYEIIGHASNSAIKYNQSVENEQDILQYYEGFLEYKGTLTKEDIDELELMKRYVLGKNGDGRDASEILKINMYQSEILSVTCIDDKETEIDESKIESLNIGYNENITKLIGYCKYNDRAYKVVLRGNNTTHVLDSTSFITESVKLIYKPEGREGTTVEYDSNGDGQNEEWVIITDRDGKVEIVSKNVAKDKDGNVLTLTLGSDDTSVAATTDLSGDGIVTYKDTAILSYNNAITTINNFCKSIVKPEIRDKVRSIGGTDNTVIPYSSTNYDNWGKNIKVDLATGDMQYELDLVKLSYHGIVFTIKDYYIASRVVREYPSSVNFCMRCVHLGKLDYTTRLVDAISDGNVSASNPSYAVRPVIVNPSGI